ncbi:unnamed protein product [Brachionus calyciflorus]|uniref:Trafficking protein particle complex subunit 2-like protein n=1 Tax=Brachionus calyciflorus TaxID=104777 RepID=A0A813YBY2_9BILA|nr:unnamed protein product [Brachionus calyciflorus]
MASCIALVAKENYPLYIKTVISPSQSVLSEQNLKYWYLIHTCLDVIDEKLRKVDNKDLYLGLLYLIEDYRIYGYVTNTKIKIFIVIESSNQQFHDTEIKIMFKKLHAGYISTINNPFCDIGKTIVSKKFEELVKTMLQKVTNPIMNSSQTAILTSNNSQQSLTSTNSGQGTGEYTI